MKIDNDILRILSTCVIDGFHLTITEIIDRKTYIKVNGVIQALGGKWSKKEKSHVFDTDANELIESVILTGEVLTNKDFDFFPTPEIIVQQMIELTNIQSHHLVLEPSAGQGHIAKFLAPICKLECIEINPSYIKTLEEQVGKDVKIIEGDFLSIPPIKNVDRVVMNPPFSKRMDIVHVEHAMKFLVPNGKLVSIMSDGITFRMDKKGIRFREMIEDHNGTIDLIPDGSFKESGTMIRTVMVTMTAK